MFLTQDDLATLTGYVRPSKQREWLRINNIEHDVALSGYPRVRVETITGVAAERERSHDLPVIIPNKPPLLPLAAIEATRAPYKIGVGIADSGIYFLWHDDDLLYIGLSVAVSSRLRAHFMQRIDAPHRAIWFNAFATVSVPEYWLKEIELEYIRRERPPRNIRGNHDDA